DMLDFFTLRAIGDGLTAYMPGSRDLLIHKGSRVRESPVEPGERLGDTETRTDDVLGPDADGMACYRLRGGAAASMQGPPVAGTGGQFYCVIGGIAEWDGAPYGPKSLAWVPPDGEPLEIRGTGNTGFDVLVMQFPGSPSYPPPEHIEVGAEVGAK